MQYSQSIYTDLTKEYHQIYNLKLAIRLELENILWSERENLKEYEMAMPTLESIFLYLFVKK